jgi:hypothetical protein
MKASITVLSEFLIYLSRQQLCKLWFFPLFVVRRPFLDGVCYRGLCYLRGTY